MGWFHSMAPGASQQGSDNALQGSFGNSVNVHPEKNRTLCLNTACTKATPLKFCPSRTVLAQPYTSYSAVSDLALRAGRNSGKSGLLAKCILCAVFILAM